MILGIDPGTTNFGWCIVNADTLERVSDGNIKLSVPANVQGADAKTACAVARELDALVAQVELVVPEQQMRRQMDIVCGATLGYALACAKEVMSVHPRSVKRRFGIPPGGSHANNKILALKKCEEWGIKFDTSHSADAYLCARYAAVILKEKGSKKRKQDGSSSTQRSIVPDSSRRPRCGNILLLLESKLRMQSASSGEAAEGHLSDSSEQRASV